MNLYYIVIAIIIILLIFPTLRTTVFNYIIPSNLINTSSSNKPEKLEKFEGKNKKVVFTAYTADWCPHCVDFKSNVYGQLKSAFDGHPYISIRNVDCTNDQQGRIKTEGGKSLDGFPTLVTNIYVNGQMNESIFEGNRNDVNGLVNYLKKI
jgi:thiol:disulfide interchange protein